MKQYYIKILSIASFLIWCPLMTILGQQTIPSGTSTVVLQTDYPGNNTFSLPAANNITAGGSGVTGNNSQNWYFTNRGNINAGSASIGSGIQLGSIDPQTSTVWNYGTIISQWLAPNGPAGVQFTNGGIVYNYLGGTIEGYDGVHTDVGSIMVENQGTIHGYDSGSSIYSGEGALIKNLVSGMITGNNFGISANGNNNNIVVENYGTIDTKNQAIHLYNGNTYAVYNAPGATIKSGGGQTILLQGSKGYLLNEGRIEAEKTAINSDNDQGENKLLNTNTIIASDGFGIQTTNADNGNTIYNLGILTGSKGAFNIVGNNTLLVLGQTAYLSQLNRYVTGPGSQLNGDAVSTGTGNKIKLTDSGSEDSKLSGFDSLEMNGNAWSLDSALTLIKSLQVKKGNLTLKNDLSITDPGNGVTIFGEGILTLKDSLSINLNASSSFIVENNGKLIIDKTNSTAGKNGLKILGNTSFGGNILLNGNINIENNLALGNAILNIHPGIDTIKINGDLNSSTGNNQINLYSGTPGTYTIITSTGSISGDATNFVQLLINGTPANPYSYEFITESNAVKVVLTNNNSITILEQPKDTTICLGGDYTFRVTAKGHDLSYQWYKGNNMIMGANSNTFSINNAIYSDYERYYVKISGSGGVTKVSDLARLWIASPVPEPIIITAPDIVSVGKSTQLSVGNPGYIDGISYIWNFGSPNEDIFAEDNEIVNVVFNTPSNSQQVFVTVIHPCGPYIGNKNIQVTYPTGIDKISDNTKSVQIYPNPATSSVNISLNDSYTNSKILSLTISDINGRTVYQKQINSTGTQINIDGWSKGIYFIKTTIDSKTEIYKFVKK